MPAANSKPAASASRVVLYARVSSKEQREEGYSIEAQLRLLRDYAEKHAFVVSEEFIDVESASKSGRTGFNTMLAYLRKHRELSVAVRSSETVALRHPIVPVGDGFGGGLVGVDGGQL